MALPGPGNGPSAATAIEAYERRCQGSSYREIAAALSGPPHFCGNHTTAARWVKLGHALVTRDEDGRFDPMRKRRARREMAIDELDRLRTRMAADLSAADIDREAFYKYQIQIILAQAKLGAWQAAPPTTRVRVTDSGRVSRVSPDLLGALAAVPGDELDELIEKYMQETLPNGKDPR